MQVKTVIYGTSEEIVAELENGHLDMSGIVAAYPVLSMATQRPDLFSVYMTNQQTAARFVDFVVVRPGLTVETPEDLKGLTVGVFPGSSTRTITNVMLSPYLNPDTDVTIVEVPPPLQMTQLEEGLVDALITLEPFASIAVAQGIGEIAIEAPMSKYVRDYFTLGAAVVTSDFAARRPGQARAAVAALEEALDILEQQESELKGRLLSEYTPVPALVAEMIHTGNPLTAESTDVQAFQDLAHIYFDHGELPSLPDIGAMMWRAR